MLLLIAVGILVVGMVEESGCSTNKALAVPFGLGIVHLINTICKIGYNIYLLNVNSFIIIILRLRNFYFNTERLFLLAHFVTQNIVNCYCKIFSTG